MLRASMMKSLTLVIPRKPLENRRGNLFEDNPSRARISGESQKDTAPVASECATLSREKVQVVEKDPDAESSPDFQDEIPAAFSHPAGRNDHFGTDVFQSGGNCIRIIRGNPEG